MQDRRSTTRINVNKSGTIYYYYQSINQSIKIYRCLSSKSHSCRTSCI